MLTPQIKYARTAPATWPIIPKKKYTLNRKAPHIFSSVLLRK